MGPKWRLEMPDDIAFSVGPLGDLEGEVLEWINAKLPGLVPPDGYKIAWHAEMINSKEPGMQTLTVRAELKPIIRFADD